MKNRSDQHERQLQELLQRAHAAMEAGRYDESERLFRRALQYERVPAAINNLAVMQLEHHRRPEEALQLLRTNLEDPDLEWQPFAHALAARCLVRLDRPDEARRYLEQAVRDFDVVWSSRRLPLEAKEMFQEYTTVILQASGELGNHRRVWQLYQRWMRHHVIPANHYYGGIAAFNLGRFRSAEAAWKRVTDRQWSFVRAYISVAKWCEQGLVPPIILDYQMPDSPDEARRFFAGATDAEEVRGDARDEKVSDAPDEKVSDAPDEIVGGAPGKGVGDVRDDEDGVIAATAALISRPANQVIMLWAVLGPFIELHFPGPDEGAFEGLQHLIAASGDWGEALAHNLLLSPDVAEKAKMAAGHGLVRGGRVGPDEPVQMWLDGEIREVLFRRNPVRLVDGRPEWSDRLREAFRLRDVGKTKEAKRLMHELAFHEDGIWPPAAINYANMLWHEGELAEARRWLEVCDSLVQAEPAVLYNLAGVSFEMDDLEAARYYLDELDAVVDDYDYELPAEIVESVAFMKQELRLAEGAEGDFGGAGNGVDGEDYKWLLDEHVKQLMRDIEARRRRDVEEKPMPPNTTTLQSGLRKIPVGWLEAACQLYGLDEPRLKRAEREAWLREVIAGRPDHVLKALEEIDNDGSARELLLALLNAGGVLKSGAITRRFGSDEDDGFYWESVLPESPLGKLRVLCLVFVGRGNIDGRRYRLAVVPTDLRASLLTMLGGDSS